MLIARQKKQENVAEYLLYMWQVEDSIRACGFDMELIDAHLVNRFDVSDEVRREIHDWYENLCLMMQNEHLEKGGHLQINKNIVEDLNENHLSFVQNDWQYQVEYQKNLQILSELRMKNSLENVQQSDVEMCFNLLYMTMLMRMQKKQISEPTEKAVQSISALLKMLMMKIKKREAEELEKAKE